MAFFYVHSTLCLNWTTQQAACACCERKNICSIFTKLCFVLYGICFDETPTFNTNHSFECLFYLSVSSTIFLQIFILYVKIIHILFSTYFLFRLTLLCLYGTIYLIYYFIFFKRIWVAGY